VEHTVSQGLQPVLLDGAGSDEGGMMAFNIQDIIGGSVADGVAKIISLFKLPPEAALQHQEALEKIQADMQAKIVDATTAEINEGGQIIQAEAKSQSWLPRNVRPLLLLLWGLLITLNYIMGVVAQFAHIAYSPVVLPDWVFKLTAIGFTGYVTARTWEKVTDSDN